MLAERRAFTKMTGAGNDFILLEGGGPVPTTPDILSLCDRRFGIGADGLMILRDAVPPGAEAGRGEPSFFVDFFNSDGSTGMLCGNGARCVIEYARLTGRARIGEPLRFGFSGATYEGIPLAPGRARFQLSPTHELREVRGLPLGELLLEGHFVDVGSLHFILDIATLRSPDGSRLFPSLDQLPVCELGRSLRHHERFAPRGVNVSFVEHEPDRLRIRTYERGVEDETLACGTGSTAAALVAWRRGLLAPPLRVLTRGGEELLVDIQARDEALLSLGLSGPARKVFEGVVELTELSRPRRLGP